MTRRPNPILVLQALLATTFCPSASALAIQTGRITGPVADPTEDMLPGVAAQIRRLEA